MIEFLGKPGSADNVFLIILLTGIVTYITRSFGYVVLSRFDALHPRVEAVLEAVPAAVLVTLVLPPALQNGPLEIFALILAMIASLRFSPSIVLACGMALVILGRYNGF